MTAKILVIDNDAAVRHLLEVRLKQAGYQVSTIADSSSAFDRVRVERPDVVITTILASGLDGLSLTRQLKSQPDFSPLVILLTPLNSDSDIAAGFAAGADDYLTKPFSPLVLIERVRVNLIRTGRLVTTAQEESEIVDD